MVACGLILGKVSCKEIASPASKRQWLDCIISGVFGAPCFLKCGPLVERPGFCVTNTVSASVFSSVKGNREFPGGPVVGTRHFHGRGPGVQSLLGEPGSLKLRGLAKKKKRRRGKKWE